MNKYVKIIEDKIKWCEENKKIKDGIVKKNFIKGLKQAIFLIKNTDRIEKEIDDE